MRSPAPTEGEHQIDGSTLGLPLVRRLGAIHSHRAARISWHTHEHFELLCLLEGATAYEFTDGRAVELRGGQFLVVPPNVVHRGAQDVRMPVNLCGIVFDPRRPGAWRNTPFTRADLTWLTARFQSHAMTISPLGPELRRLATSLSRHIRGHAESPADEAAGCNLRWLTCGALMEAARQFESNRSQLPERTVAEAVQHMEQHLASPISLETLARQAGYSRSRWFQLFKEATGMTPNDYLQRLRVAKARELLSGSQETVTGIAFAVGFSSSQYFSTVFRKYSGMTPAAYRAREEYFFGSRCLR